MPNKQFNKDTRIMRATFGDKNPFFFSVDDESSNESLRLSPAIARIASDGSNVKIIEWELLLLLCFVCFYLFCCIFRSLLFLICQIWSSRYWITRLDISGLLYCLQCSMGMQWGEGNHIALTCVLLRTLLWIATEIRSKIQTAKIIMSSDEFTFSSI